MGNFSGGAAGGGGLSTSSSSASGDADGTSGSGSKIFNFGTNTAASSIESTLSNPFVIGGVVLAVWLLTRRR